MSPCPIGIDAPAYRWPTVYFYTVVSGEINYLLTYLLYMGIFETHHPGYRALRHIATGSSVKTKCLTTHNGRFAVS